MITLDEVKQIADKLSQEDLPVTDGNLIDDISCIVYCNDVFECGDGTVNTRHIDIEFSFGDYYEIQEEDPAFQFICSLCKLPMTEEEQELIIYEK